MSNNSPLLFKIEPTTLSHLRPLKLTINNTLIYGVGGFISKAVGFFMLPILTRLFTPEDYGRIELLSLINSFLGCIFTMGMSSGLAFYYFGKDGNPSTLSKSYVSSVFQWRLLWGILITLAAAALSPKLNRAFFDGQLSMGVFLVCFLGAFFAQFIYQTNEIFSLLFKPIPFIVLSLVFTLSSLALSIYLVIYLKMGYVGYFAGSLISAVLLTLVSVYLMRHQIEFGWKWRHWPAMLQFGFPIMLAEIITYFLQSMDRWFIRSYGNTSDVGIYAVGNKVALIVFIGVSTFRLAFNPASMQWVKMEYRAQADALFEASLRWYGFLFFSLTVLMTVSARTVLTLLAPDLYSSAHRIVAPLCLAHVFLGGTFLSSMGAWKAQKTYLHTICLVIAVALQVGLDWFFVPHFGSVGAAYATTLSMACLFFLSMTMSHTQWKIGFNFKTLFIQTGIIGLFLVFSLFFSIDRLMMCNLGALTLIALGVVSLKHDETRWILAQLRNLFPQSSMANHRGHG